MPKTEHSRYPPLVIDGYNISGIRHGNGDVALYWHIRSHSRKTGVGRDLVVEGEILKTAISSVREDGTIKLKVTDVRASISFAEREAILDAIARWERARRVPA